MQMPGGGAGADPFQDSQWGRAGAGGVGSHINFGGTTS